MTQRQRAESLIENIPNPPDIVLAAYIPRDDVIVMPYFADKNDFAYYAVLLHECIHMSGHPSRLGRYSIGSDGKLFGDEQEELVEDIVAECGGALLCAYIGIINKTCQWHEDKITEYISQLQDKSLLKLATQQALEACQYITGKKHSIGILPFSIKKLLPV